MNNSEKKEQPSVKIPKAIAITARFLEKTSPSLLVKFLTNIFVTPIQYPTPQREKEMEKNSVQETLLVSTINKKINIYRYQNLESTKKVLLVHGWSGRGTQLFAIANEFGKMGYQCVSFDGPAHGKSEGKQSHMKEFIDSIHAINQNYGPFEYVIGHSLGAMSVANAIKEGLATKKAVLICGGDIVTDVIDDFISRFRIDEKFSGKIQRKFEKKFNLKMNDYSVSHVAKNINIPCLIIHDKNDTDVNVNVAYNINKHIKNSELIITEGLGHRKILGDKKVIHKLIDFVKK